MRLSVRGCLTGALILIALWCGSAAAELECPPLEPAAVDADAGHRNGRGLLWRVTAPGSASSVIFGTMHIGDARVAVLPAAVRREFDASRRFLLEVVLDEKASAELQQAMFYGDDRRLDDVVGAELAAAARGRLQGYGISTAMADRMKPWSVFMTLSMPAGAPDAPLDLQLMLEALGAGKEVQGLETVAEQIAVFDTLPAATQVEMLRGAVCHYDLFQRELERMIDLYVARDVAELMRMTLRYTDPSGLALLDALLWQRNRRMVERLQGVLAEGAAFVAIGALHLPGEEGVLALLQKRGYAVEAIY